MWKKRNIYEKKKKTVNVIATANYQFSSISARFDQVDATLIMSLSVFFIVNTKSERKGNANGKFRSVGRLSAVTEQEGRAVITGLNRQSFLNSIVEM